MTACPSFTVIVVVFKVIRGGADNLKDTTPGNVRFHLGSVYDSLKYILYYAY